MNDDCYYSIIYTFFAFIGRKKHLMYDNKLCNCLKLVSGLLNEVKLLTRLMKDTKMSHKGKESDESQ